ncbi:MAG: hypothetical protein ACLPVW_08275 [Terriglobales bacterium]
MLPGDLHAQVFLEKRVLLADTEGRQFIPALSGLPVIQAQSRESPPIDSEGGPSYA